MERVAIARMATAKLQRWTHEARKGAVSGAVSPQRNKYE